jgi:lipopolysaccharide transport system ATP-binding protein
MSEAVIVAEHLAKQYRIGETSSYDTLAEALRRRFGGRAAADARSEARNIWALHDVSFEVRQGEIVGIIGRNGAGKSTLLKILSRITAPTRGRAVIRGRVGSLLEVGTGFQPELTGRENVFLNGAILGMSRAEIARKFDEIVEFSEIAEFIDTPVKRYSSGMHARLAFSVAAHLEPEILIVDEVLSVGDIAFQRKCQQKMQSFMQSGRTVLFVSHSMGAITEMCTSAILLDHGTIVRAGAVPHVMEGYFSLLNATSGPSGHRAGPLVHADLEILSANVLAESGKPTHTFDVGDPVVLEFRYRVKRDLFSLHIELTVSRNMLELIRSYDTDGYKDPNRQCKAGDYVCRHVLPGRFLKAGSYSVKIGAGTPDYSMIEADNILAFEVEEISENTQHRGYRAARPGQVISPGKWTTERIAESSAQRAMGEP